MFLLHVNKAFFEIKKRKTVLLWKPLKIGVPLLFWAFCPPFLLTVAATPPPPPAGQIELLT